jgi:sulfatase-modifying factor enzyme 1
VRDELERASARASGETGDDTRCPPPKLLPVARRASVAAVPPEMIEPPLAGEGEVEMTIRHERRECGCYPLGATEDAMWGWFYKDTITHRLDARLGRYAIRRAPVTNAEFLEFVRRAAYRPADEGRFLLHIARGADGAWPGRLAAGQADRPVTFVSLADARAYAAWRGQRLPTEAEWQWAAEAGGPDVTGMSGGAWELTESEHTDGHSRFVMLRGGAPLPPRTSEWLVERGKVPRDSHAKYVLLADVLDRSEALSFRTVVDLA